MRTGHGAISLVRAAGGHRRVIATLALLSLVAVSFALGVLPLSRPHRSSQTLPVQSVQIVDGSGTVRLRLGVSPDGTPSVRLYDYAGTRRLELAVDPDGPTIRMFDGQGVERRMLEASPGLEPSSEDAAAGP